MLTIKLIARSELLVSIGKEGKSISEFATSINVSDGYMSQIFSGKRNPSAKIAYKITEALGLEIEDIFSIEAIELQGCPN